MSSEVKRTAGGALLLDGMQLRDETVAKIKATIAAAGNPKICLATVLIGDDPPSHIYVANKHKKAQEAGMVSKGLQLPADATQAQVENAVSELVADKTVHGILVQLPLPKHINTEAVLALLPVEKDVDGLTERSLVVSFEICRAMCHAHHLELFEFFSGTKSKQSASELL